MKIVLFFSIVLSMFYVQVNAQCFNSPTLQVTPTGTNGSGDCTFDLDVLGSVAPPNVFLGYEVNAASSGITFLPDPSYTYPTGSSYSFVANNNTGPYTVTVKLVGYNPTPTPGSSPCCVEILTKTVECISGVGSAYKRSLGTKSVETNGGIYIYPNPAKDHITVYYGLTGKYTVMITDVTGRLIESKTSDSQLTQISLSGKTTGVYVVQIMDEKGDVQKREKIVLE